MGCVSLTEITDDDNSAAIIYQAIADLPKPNRDTGFPHAVSAEVTPKGDGIPPCVFRVIIIFSPREGTISLTYSSINDESHNLSGNWAKLDHSDAGYCKSKQKVYIQ